MSFKDTQQSYHFKISRMRSSGNVMHSHHFHSYFEIYYMIGGSCRYFIDNHTYEVTEGDIILIPAGVIHRTDYDGKPHERILLECSLEFIPPKLLGRLEGVSSLYRNPKVARDLHELLLQLETEHRAPDEYSREMTRAIMHVFFFTLIRNKSLISTATDNASVTERVVSYIQKNYAAEVRLSEVAKQNFVSPEHLSRTFKRETGFGFSEFLTLTRLKQAEKMLKEGEGSISDVAYSCGFNDSNYFSDVFKRTYGIPPYKFSKMYKSR